MSNPKRVNAFYIGGENLDLDFRISRTPPAPKASSAPARAANSPVESSRSSSSTPADSATTPLASTPLAVPPPAAPKAAPASAVKVPPLLSPVDAKKQAELDSQMPL